MVSSIWRSWSCTKLVGSRLLTTRAEAAPAETTSETTPGITLPKVKWTAAADAALAVALLRVLDEEFVRSTKYKDLINETMIEQGFEFTWEATR
jgi:hypothetical protein